jgi:hypothetical protein
MISLYCAFVVGSASAMIDARAKGVDRSQAMAVVAELQGDERRVSEVLLWYVYDVNPKGRTSKAKSLELIQRACESSEVNALTDRTKIRG